MTSIRATLLLTIVALLPMGCASQPASAPHDRPFPLGQVTDAHWETQQTNAEAADFIFHDHEFRGDTAQLGPAGQRHLEEVALRLPHVPFPVVVAASENGNYALDEHRTQTILAHLTAMGVEQAEGRVVAARSFAEGFTAVEAESAYRRGVLSTATRNGARGGTQSGTYR